MAAITRLATRVSFVSSLARRYQFFEFNSHAPPNNSSPFGVVPTRGEDQKNRHVRWVFLGCPGVGKGTYASRLSSLLGVPHIATGDLVREELASSGPLSTKVFFFFLLSIFILFYFKLSSRALLHQIHPRIDVFRLYYCPDTLILQ
jgi:hypothetical protein